MIGTSKDISIVEVASMSILRDASGSLFANAPSKVEFYTAHTVSAIPFIVNDGKVHSMMNNGQFGASRIRDEYNSNYSISRYHIPTTYPVFFDNTSSSFVVGSTYSNTLAPANAGAGNIVPLKKNNLKALFMGVKVNTYPNYLALGVFEEKANPSVRRFAHIKYDYYGAITFLSNDVIPTSDKLYSATNLTPLDGDEDMLYFVVGKEVWSRNLSNGVDVLQYTIPSDESVTFMTHRKYTGYNTDPAYNYNYIFIATKKGSEYVLRAFTKTAGNIVPTPAFTLTGTGEVRNLIYVTGF